jgi:Flp pilus assembly protein TadD
LLARALELSPDYAPIWAEMGLAELRESELASKAEDIRRASERGEKALRRALELDPELAVAHARLAGAQRARWDFVGAERSISTALAVDPRSAIVLANAAYLNASIGKLNEAISLQERACEADPLSAIGHSNLGSYYLLAGRLDEAEAQSRKGIELRAEDAVSYMSLGTIFLLRGRAEEARPYFAKLFELANPGESGRLWIEAIVERSAGNAAASQRAAEEFEKRFGGEDPASCAEIRSWRGDTDAAFAWLDKSLAVRDPSLAQLKLSPSYSRLHGDPRWNELLKKVGLPTD